MLALKGTRDSLNLDEMEQPLQILLNTLLTEPFGLNSGSQNFNEVLSEYLDELDQECDLLSAWQRLSFYEWITPRFREQESEPFQTASDLFIALFRSNKVVS